MRSPRPLRDVEIYVEMSYNDGTKRCTYGTNIMRATCEWVSLNNLIYTTLRSEINGPINDEVLELVSMTFFIGKIRHYVLIRYEYNAYNLAASRLHANGNPWPSKLYLRAYDKPTPIHRILVDAGIINIGGAVMIM